MLQAGDDCPDSNLAIKGVANAPQYVIGDQPKFTMVVTNIGLVACKRDVGAAVLAAYVYPGQQSAVVEPDCAPSNETLVKTFNPGEQVTTEVTWTGMGSAPQCPLPVSRSAPAPTTWWCNWGICVLPQCRSLSPTPRPRRPPNRRRRPVTGTRTGGARPGTGSRRLRSYRTGR